MKRLLSRIEKALSNRYDERELKYVYKALCLELLGISQTTFYLKEDVSLSFEDEELLNSALHRLIEGEPLQYVIGRTQFCGLSLIVDSNVLIPRPETGELIEWICESVREKDVRLLDIGTGSGCIAIALSKRFHSWKIDGWDISQEALSIANKNNIENGTSVTFSKCDILSDMESDFKYDVIVSNPPYITDSERKEMENTVVDFEPHEALFVPDGNPLLFYNAIAKFGKKNLQNNGHLFFEINPLFTDEIREMLYEYGYENIIFKQDIFGKTRMIKADIHE
jgi:release factor glutamine methyltransferase